MKIVQTNKKQSPIILVTGGGGYIGSHACKALQKEGYTPVTFDNFSTGWREAIKFGPLAEGDLLDINTLAKAFDYYKPEAVMHFAALSNVKESMSKPDLYWSNNVIGSLNLLSTMRDFNCKKLVLSSTAAIYGQPNINTIVENTSKEPINPYGASKLAVESIAKNFEEAYGIRFIALRYFNVAGADPEGEIGERHIPETHLIPLILKAAVTPKNSITVFGTDYLTPDGTCIRDYIHVIDLISAHILGLNYLENNGTSAYINLGTEKGFSVKEVIKIAESITNTPLKIQFGERREGDPSRLVCSNKVAKQLLKWDLHHSTLEKMIKDAWSWEQQNRF